jgi:hypothetical protein
MLFGLRKSKHQSVISHKSTLARTVMMRSESAALPLEEKCSGRMNSILPFTGT